MNDPLKKYPVLVKLFGFGGSKRGFDSFLYLRLSDATISQILLNIIRATLVWRLAWSTKVNY